MAGIGCPAYAVDVPVPESPEYFDTHFYDEDWNVVYRNAPRLLFTGTDEGEWNDSTQWEQHFWNSTGLEYSDVPLAYSTSVYIGNNAHVHFRDQAVEAPRIYLGSSYYDIENAPPGGSYIDMEILGGSPGSLTVSGGSLKIKTNVQDAGGFTPMISVGGGHHDVGTLVIEGGALVDGYNKRIDYREMDEDGNITSPKSRNLYEHAVGVKLSVSGTSNGDDSSATIKGEGTVVYAKGITAGGHGQNLDDGGVGWIVVEDGAKILNHATGEDVFIYPDGPDQPGRLLIDREPVYYRYKDSYGNIYDSYTMTIGGDFGSTQREQGSVTVRGAGSEIDLADSGIRMGLSGGEGELIIESGGKVSGSYLHTASYQEPGVRGGTAEIKVTGSGSELNLHSVEYAYSSTYVQRNGGNILLGETGTATMTISDGGRVSAEAGITLGQHKGVGHPNIYWGDANFYDSKGVIRIGEGGAAGFIDTPEITTGNGTGQIIFNHNEAGYLFDIKLTGNTEVILDKGTTILAGDNSHTGGTIVQGTSTLLLGHANALGDGPLEVREDGTFGVAAGVTGVQLEELLFDDGSTITLTLPTSQEDALLFNILGELTLGDVPPPSEWGEPVIPDTSYLTFNINLSESFDASSGYEWTFAQADGGIVNFENIDFSFNMEGWSVSSDGTSLTLSYAAIPEPSTFALIALGAASLLCRGRRRLLSTTA